MAEDNVAVLIDYENTGLDSVQYLLDQLSDVGRVIIRRAYADWSIERGKRDQLLELGIEARHLFRSTRSGKNSSDILLTMDAIELLYNADLDTFVIVSSDSDFVPLVSKLRGAGKTVIGAGRRDVTSATLIKSCDRYIFFDDAETSRRVSGRARTRGTASPPPVEAASPLVRALEASMDGQGQVVGSKLYQTMLRIDPSFNFKALGHRTFTQYLESSKEIKVDRPRGRGDVVAQLVQSRDVESKDTSSRDTSPRDTSPRDTSPRDTSPRDASPRDTSPGDTSPGDTSPRDTSPRDTSPRDTSPRDTSPRDTSPRDTSPRDTSPRDTSPRDTSPRDTSPRDTSPRDTSPRDASPRDTSPRDTSPRDTSPRDASPRDASPRDASPRDASPRDTSPRDASPRDASPRDSESNGSSESLSPNWERDVDDAWSRRNRNGRLSGQAAAVAAAQALNRSSLKTAGYRSLDKLLDASPFLRTKWRRDGNAILRLEVQEGPSTMQVR